MKKCAMEIELMAPTPKYGIQTMAKYLLTLIQRLTKVPRSFIQNIKNNLIFQNKRLLV